jgi:hypothetical protein
MMHTEIPPIRMGNIDHAFVQCPHCYEARKVEWARRPNRMPPQRITCWKCNAKTKWEDNIFMTYEEYAGIPSRMWYSIEQEVLDEDRKTE